MLIFFLIIRKENCIELDDKHSKEKIPKENKNLNNVKNIIKINI